MPFPYSHHHPIRILNYAKNQQIICNFSQRIFLLSLSFFHMLLEIFPYFPCPNIFLQEFKRYLRMDYLQFLGIFLKSINSFNSILTQFINLLILIIESRYCLRILLIVYTLYQNTSQIFLDYVFKTI